jgi:arylsulfatase A-like enzyme
MVKTASIAVLLTAAAACTARAADKPNVIYLMLDEWGYYESSAMGHPVVETPNIDRVAAEGMRFTQLLAGGNVCAPTRCAMMTGQHTGHCPVRDNFPRVHLHPDDVTIAELLKQAGYAVGGFGKWGIGDRGTTGAPEKQGFDVFFGYYNQNHAHSYYPAFLVRNGEKVPLAGNTGSAKEGKTYSQDLIFRASVEFITKNAEAGQPFFAYLPWTPPHGNFEIPDDEPAWQKYKDLDLGGQAASRVYGAMVEMDDRQLGEILDVLKKTGVDQNTILFVSGDNGGNLYFADKEHPDGIYRPNVDPRSGQRFRGHKGNFYEGGLRVPFLVRWPGQVAAGAVSDHLGYFPDVLPTLAELVGADLPEDVDGISILPTLLGRGEQKEHEYLYWENAGSTAVRIGDWKAVRPSKKAQFELYNLGPDIEELHDVAADHPDVIARVEAIAQEAHRPPRLGLVLDPEMLWETERAKPEKEKAQ